MRRGLIISLVMPLILTAMGCGQSPQTPAPLQPVSPQPVPTPYPVATPSPYDPYNPYNPYDPNGSSVNAPLTARIDSKKNGVLLGIGTFSVQVSVVNPASVPQTGQLRVSILDNGSSIRDFTETVQVPAGQTVSRSYSDPRWRADDATVSITPAPASQAIPNTAGPTTYDPNASTGYPGSATYDPTYGANPSYGTTYGASPPYGTGTTYDPSYGSTYPATSGTSYGYPSSYGATTGYPTTSTSPYPTGY